MIILLLIVPLIGVLLLLPLGQGLPVTVKNPVSLKQVVHMPKASVYAADSEKMKKIALFISLINLAISIYMWFIFDYSISSYQFVYEFNNLNFCHLHLGVDGISLFFVLLTTFITPICILSNWTDITVKLKYFLISFLILETLQIAIFVVLDLFLFYIFFESVLIPLFFIVLIWGGSRKKFRAAFLLFLYTLAGSLFMLLSILYIYQNTASTDFLFLSLVDIDLYYQKLLWLSLSFSKKDMTCRFFHSSNYTFNINDLALFYRSDKALQRSTCEHSSRPRAGNPSCPWPSSGADLSRQSYDKKISTRSKAAALNYLVKFGSNLGSTLKYERFSLSIRNMCYIPAHLNSILVGILLSDGYLYKNKTSKTLLALNHKNLEYFGFF